MLAASRRVRPTDLDGPDGLAGILEATAQAVVRAQSWEDWRAKVGTEAPSLLVLLPIYWTRLTPADFGIIGIAQLVQMLLTPVLGLGLPDSAQRSFLEWSERERGRHLFMLTLAAALAGALICLALELAGGALFALVFQQVAYDPYVRLAVWTAFHSETA